MRRLCVTLVVAILLSIAFACLGFSFGGAYDLDNSGVTDTPRFLPQQFLCMLNSLQWPKGMQELIANRLHVVPGYEIAHPITKHLSSIALAEVGARKLGTKWSEEGAIAGFVITAIAAALHYYLAATRENRQFAKAARRETPSWAKRICVGKVPYSPVRWTAHLGIAATTRAGKTTTITNLVAPMRLAGIPGLAIDNNSDLFSKFYKPATDSILSLSDRRGEPYSFFNEVRAPRDIDRIAYNLIPENTKDTAGSSQYFDDRARSLFITCCSELWARGTLTNGVFVDVLNDNNKLHKLFSGTGWDITFATARSGGDIYSTMRSRFAIFEKLPRNAGLSNIHLSADGKSWKFTRTGQSLRATAERMAAGASTFVWVTYRDADLAIERPWLAAISSTWNQAVMGLREAPERRILSIFDEAGEIGQIAGLLEALTRGGKYGLSVILGLQNIAQFRRTYGEDGARVILGNLSSLLLMRLPDYESAVWAANVVGQKYQRVESVTKGVRVSTTTTREEHRYVIEPTTIQHLRPLHGILIYFGYRHPCRVKLKPRKYPELYSRYVEPLASSWMPHSTNGPRVAAQHVGSQAATKDALDLSVFGIGRDKK